MTSTALSRVTETGPAAVRRHVAELRLALTEATDVPNAKRIIDATTFLAEAAKKAHLSLETVNEVQQIRLEAEIRLGHELSRMKAAGKIREGRPWPKEITVTEDDSYKLNDFGITKNLSSRSQFLAEHEAEVQALLPQILEQLSELSVLQLYADLRRRDTAAALADQLADIAAVAPPTPEGVFDVLVIDPPCPIERIERDVRPLQAASLEYPTMREEELLAWDIPRAKAADDCHLFLWTTHHFLPLAFQCLKEWGAKYTCMFVWHKTGGFQPVNFPQLNCEFCLYARYGSPRFVDLKGFAACFDAPRGRHSEKPELFYELLRRVTGGRRLDLFNRRLIDGFIGWGKESARELQD